MDRIRFIFLGLFLVLNQPISAKQQRVQLYTENLSSYRTKFDHVPISFTQPPFPKPKARKKYIFPIEHEITQQLHELLLDLKSYYEMTEFILGYTIQVYTGTNRQLAFQIRDQLYNLYSNLDVEIQYKQPNFTVGIGRFLERIEAFESYVGIKKLLPQSIIRPTQFPNKADIFSKQNIKVADNSQDLKTEGDMLFETDTRDTSESQFKTVEELGKHKE